MKFSPTIIYMKKLRSTDTDMNTFFSEVLVLRMEEILLRYKMSNLLEKFNQTLIA